MSHVTRDERPSVGRALIAPGGLFAFLLGSAILTTRSAYSLVDLVLLALVYGSASCGLCLLLRWLARRGVILELAGAGLVGLVAAWHWRELTRQPGNAATTLWTAEGLGVFLATVAVGALAILVGGRYGRLTPALSRRLTMSMGGSAVVCGLTLVIAYSTSDTFRWHLLRHNELLGTPAYHLLSPRVVEVEERDWAAHAHGAPSRQPAWILTSRSGDPRSGAGQDSQAEGQENPVQPDVVFVMLDTLRADMLEAYGGDPSWMPGLNEAAAHGFVFTDLLANSSWTRPSVASFFTGLAPEQHGATNWALPIAADVVTLAEVFHRRGYDTAAFIANHEAVNANGAFDRGFDLFEALDDSRHTYPRADYVTQRVSEWLAERDTSVTRPPLFLYVHYLDPHTPYFSGTDDPRVAMPVRDIEPDARYLAEVRFLDEHLLDLFRVLDDRLGGPRVTLVTSDHGEEFGEHDTRGHGQTLYSEVLDIPAILMVKRQTGASPRGVVDDSLEGRDFFELLLRSATANPDVPALARALDRDVRVASVSNTKDPGRSDLIHYLVRPYRHAIYSRMIQREQWRLIWSAYGPTHELYDLATDPSEVDNQASRHPELVATLKSVMDATPARWSRPETIGISEESLDRLRQLGYIR